MLSWILLLAAIAAELSGTSCLKAGRGSARPVPTLGLFAGYVLSFWPMALVVKRLSIGIVRAIWSGWARSASP